MKYLLLLLVGLSLTSCGTWNKWYPADNVVEELAEEVIEAETGLDIDLSVNTPEE